MNDKVNSVFIRVRKRFLQRQAALVSRYNAFINRLESGEATQEEIDETYTHVHRTAGTALAFEFHELSKQSLALEKCLEALLEGKDVKNNTQTILKDFGPYLDEIATLKETYLIQKRA